LLNDIEIFLNENKSLSTDQIKEYFYKKITVLDCTCNKKDIIENVKKLYENLQNFICVNPRLPLEDKNFVKTELLNIQTSLSRDEIIELIMQNASKNELANLALYTYRQMDRIDWSPFLKAAFERNPVCLDALKGKSIEEVFSILKEMPDESIYDSQRLAQPDEVWNFQRGDGVEKAILLAGFIRNSEKSQDTELSVVKGNVILKFKKESFEFKSKKNLEFSDKHKKSTLLRKVCC
jgi:hypothetical protein